MKQEDKQLLLKDLCSRLPYGVKCILSSNNIYTIKGIDLIVTDEGDWEYAVTAKGIEPIEIKYIKPYLRPMSNMTEEERGEYRSFIFDYEYDDYWNPGEYRDAVEVDTMSELIEWLNSHHFDYSNLIGRGLALPAPEGMYNV